MEEEELGGLDKGSVGDATSIHFTSIIVTSSISSFFPPLIRSSKLSRHSKASKSYTLTTNPLHSTISGLAGLLVGEKAAETTLEEDEEEEEAEEEAEAMEKGLALSAALTLFFLLELGVRAVGKEKVAILP